MASEASGFTKLPDAYRKKSMVPPWTITSFQRESNNSDHSPDIVDDYKFTISKQFSNGCKRIAAAPGKGLGRYSDQSMACTMKCTKFGFYCGGAVTLQ